MAIQIINTGSTANAGNGDSLRTAFNKVNANFAYLGSSSRSGERGFIGYTGSRGFLGYAGSQGNGYTGSQGQDGAAVDKGYTGSQGTQGIIGFTGSAAVANTGNFTFNEDTITNGNGLILETNRGTLSIGTNMEVPGVAGHFHVAFDGSNINPPPSDLFLGDDHNYVKLPGSELNDDDYGVEIGTHDRDAGNYHTWRFNTDGVLTLPSGNTRIGDFNGLDAIVGSTGTGVGVASQGPGGFVALEWIGGFENVGTTASTQVAAVVVNSPIASTSGTVQIATGLATGPTSQHVWEFGADGNLTAPGHLLPNADLAYDLGSTTTQWRSIYVGTGTIYIGGVALGVSADNYVTVDGNPIITVNTSGNLTIQGDTNLVLGAVAISDTAPAATTPGSQWFNTVDARTYIAYNDQWVDANPTHIPSPSTYLDDIQVDGSEFLINGYSLTVDETGTLLVDGEQVTGSGGAANSITSGSYSVSVADTGVVTMATSRGNLDFGALPEFGGPSHFHIMKATSSTAIDLYFGDDFNYVLQRGTSNAELEGHTNDYGVEIGTRDLSTSTSSQNVWRFETDGVLILSTASTILGNSEDPNVYIETVSTATTSTWIFAANGNLTVPGDISSAAAAGKLAIQVPTTVPLGAINITSSTGGWDYGGYGGMATTGGSGTGLTVNVIDSGGYPNLILMENRGQGYKNGETLTVTGGHGESATFTITVPNNNWTWEFGSDGRLTLPGPANGGNTRANSNFASAAVTKTTADGVWTFRLGPTEGACSVTGPVGYNMAYTITYYINGSTYHVRGEDSSGTYNFQGGYDYNLQYAGDYAVCMFQSLVGDWVYRVTFTTQSATTGGIIIEQLV